MVDLSAEVIRGLQQFFMRLQKESRRQWRGDINKTLSYITLPGGTQIKPSALPELAGDVIGQIINNTVIRIQNHPFSEILPALGQVPVWDGAQWIPGTPGGIAGELPDYGSLTNEALTILGAVATASSTYSTQVPAFLIDDLQTTYWQSNPGTVTTPTGVNGQWARIDLGSSKTIAYFRIGGGLNGYGPATWDVQSSTDNATWTTRYSGTGDIETGYVALTTPIAARYWRVLATGSNAAEPNVAVAWQLRTIALYSGRATSTGAGHIISKDDVAVTQRPILNFTGNVTVTDDAVTGSSDVNIPMPATAAPIDATYVTRTANTILTNEVLLSEVFAHELKTRWEALTNGDPDFPELLYMDGDVLYMEVVQ